MSAVVGKVEEKCTVLLDFLEKHGETSIAEIQTALGISRRTVYNYKDRLLERKIKIGEKKYGKLVKLFLENDPEELNKYTLINEKTLRVATIVRELQKTPMTVKELAMHFGIDKDNNQRSNYLNIGVLKITTENGLRIRLNELVNEGILVKDSNGKYYHSGKYVPPVLNFSFEDFYQLRNSLETVLPSHPFYNQLKGIFRKQLIILGEYQEEEESYIVQGRNYIGFETVYEDVKRFTNADFASKIIKCTIVDRKGNENEKLIAVGLLVYSMETDKLYVMGKSYKIGSKKLSKFSPLDTHSIKSIEPTEFINMEFHAQEYMDTYKEMLSIADGKSEEVEVHFVDIYNNRTKLEAFVKQRPKGKLVKVKDTLIYTDVVRGLPDLAKYLRTYGKYFKVIKPEKLRKYIVDKAVENLKLYEVDEHE